LAALLSRRNQNTNNPTLGEQISPIENGINPEIDLDGEPPDAVKIDNGETKVYYFIQFIIAN
jgi:hypothetical protein